MDHVISVVAFLGAWCLVAGPVYQAAVELQEGDAERERIARASSKVSKPPAVSPWWWLFPPVRYVLERRRDRTYRQAVLDALGPAEVAIMVDFINKASGWLLVGVGGLLIAVKETWAMDREFEWAQWPFWVLIVLMAVICLFGVTLRIRYSQRLVDPASAA